MSTKPSSITSFQDYKREYAESVSDPEGYWAKQGEDFVWNRKWDKVLEWDYQKPEFKWFIGAKLNITENALDRHLKTRGDQVALIWEANDPQEKSKKYTYNELHIEVCKAANMLRTRGVKKGDRVCIYMPMVPELTFAVLACARIGAVHSVIFAGFSAGSIVDRINDCGAVAVLTADGGYRGDKTIPLLSVVNEALEKCPTVRSVTVLNRIRMESTLKPGFHFDWSTEIAKQKSECSPEVMNAEDPLFILYTSGSTGKPKGMVHTTAGYMVYTNTTFRTVFQYRAGEVYFCTADIGWITGHSYLLYGPLTAAATTLMFEGVPTYPDRGRFWEIIEKHQVNIFYTAPTAIRSLQQFPLELVKRSNLLSLRVLGSVGEPINEEAWNWYSHEIGGDRCPVIDTWWQTETGGFMISPIAGVTKLKPSFAGLPLPGVQPEIMDGDKLAIKFPWPGQARTIYGNHKRFRETYFSAFPGKYFTGDGCKRDSDGFYRITGRVDDIVIVSGHNLGTAEIESAINEHSQVIESAVVGYPHDIKGNALYAYVICYEMPREPEKLRAEIQATVSKIIGSIAKPDKIQFVPGLPKTRSGKIMRRILRKIAEGDTSNLGDTSTLLDPGVVELIKNDKI
ncbi:MAG: acetate--CoA ligase [Xanthomonadaceae bacterium]|nr:acetate--CoA ligase [Xanthomonadaceae bacterium]